MRRQTTSHNIYKMKNHKPILRKLSNCIRVIVADAIEKASSGHPGMPLGMADVITLLAFEFLKFDPRSPRLPNRDRIVLSAGHGSMLLYAFYYLTGFKNFTLDDIKAFRQLHSKTPGHPEYGVYEAIETTTGPLGQGVGNAVGMAIAAKKSNLDHKIYCIAGDGCLMEGIGYEAASVAGHLRLNNLIVLFDNNKITIDGSTDLSVSEDHLLKFRALGFAVEEVDGHNFEEIRNALSRAQTSDVPYFISCKTIIGFGAPTKSNSSDAHGAPLGAKEVSGLKASIGMPDTPFYIPEDLLEYWRNIDTRVPNAATMQHMQSNCDILKDATLETPHSPEATRVSSGKILSYLMQNIPNIIAGSADLSLSNNVKPKDIVLINKDNYDGRYIHYGAREAAMSAIMNGLAVSGYIPVSGTFLVFSDYMRAGIRLSAISQLKVVYVMTHDSIGVGEDGPTHQPVEHLASLRAMPGLLVLRPADFAETLQCWDIAIQRCGPSVLALTRQNVPQIIQNPMVNLGAYIISDTETVDVTIFASGSEVSLALNTKEILRDKIGIRVVSVPSFELFFEQDQEYINSLLNGADLKVAIEAASSFGWHKIIGKDGVFCGIDSFGISAPAADVYNFFGLNADAIASRIIDALNRT